ncbi:LytTR family DNA-binding domain-containing protein [Liquorilactobacillus capillatus]|uniref:HTH LytTR-type domain-containing protein n=1 Tax=Liquorilactobacillus capillatus DSM 19910 TaxID=1423731 RepID=A0A0R1M0H6_9LACO|nr:LytTR family DNA-binding domain-containing protein [Liquorilactobacillus capillatus]KRL01105.1 hypothetical protein FC81_GL001244 [Liquorilactobacillus capillatus DSM 19910]
MRVNFYIDSEQEEHVDFFLKKIEPWHQDIAANLQQELTFIWGYKERIAAPLDLKHISRFYTENKYVFCSTKQGSFKVKQRIYQLVKELPEPFIQVSSSEIVNFNFVDHLEMTSTGTIIIRLDNNETALVSRRFMKELKRRLKL